MAQVKSGFKVYEGDLVSPTRDAASQAAAGVYVNGTKVVGVQGAAIADRTDAATALSGVNLVIAAMRAHGLIAT